MDRKTQNTPGLSRREVLTGGLTGGAALLGAATLLGVASPVQGRPPGSKARIFDMACDGRTFRYNRMHDDSTQLPLRGDSFIVSGKIYPGGTIERYGLAGPDQPGSIGTWVCQGTFQVDLASGELPHVASTQFFLFDNGDGLTNSGLEGGIDTVRFVTGGIGSFAGVAGSLSQQPKGENDTLIDAGPVQVPAPNYRFVYFLTK